MVGLRGLMFCDVLCTCAPLTHCHQQSRHPHNHHQTATKTIILIIGITINVTLFVVFVQHHTQPLPDPQNYQQQQQQQQQRPDGRHRFMIYGASAGGLTRFDTFLQKAHAHPPPPPPLRKRLGHATSKLNYLRLLREAAKHQPGVRTNPKKHTLALTPHPPTH